MNRAIRFLRRWIYDQPIISVRVTVKDDQAESLVLTRADGYKALVPLPLQSDIEWRVNVRWRNPLFNEISKN